MKLTTILDVIPKLRICVAILIQIDGMVFNEAQGQICYFWEPFLRLVDRCMWRIYQYLSLIVCIVLLSLQTAVYWYFHSHYLWVERCNRGVCSL